MTTDNKQRSSSARRLSQSYLRIFPLPEFNDESISVVQMNPLSQLSALLLTIVVISKNSFGELVEINDGRIQGTTMETRTGESFHSFMRIPFAEPPIGELRFQAPVPVKPWNVVVNATQFSAMCMQVNLLSQAEVSEDCLYLNVFTKSLPPTNEGELKPVIAYIHGGAFQLGSSSDHQPHLMMERDVVLVTINYRVGAFGFLSLGTREIPGNAGMKDQVLALKWIQRNIESFGGDPSKVTLMGNSAGAYSATAHMVSPMSDGLFHRVVALSGSITYQRKLEMDYLSLAQMLASKMNCTTSSTDAMVACLREVFPSIQLEI